MGWVYIIVVSAFFMCIMVMIDEILDKRILKNRRWKRWKRKKKK